jgi:hypothetical protein
VDVRRLPPGAGVSEREAEVLAAIGEHMTNAEISGRLFIGPHRGEPRLLPAPQAPGERPAGARSSATVPGTPSPIQVAPTQQATATGWSAT